MHPNDILGQRYELAEMIASGEMGELWRATDSQLSRSVAVKILPRSLSDISGLREQFRIESLKISTIDHPSVITVHDYAEDTRPDGSLAVFVVMELVDAPPLSQLLKRPGGLDMDTALTVIGNSAEALEHLHRAGVVHRALTPNNILVHPNNSVVLKGFEISRPPSADSEPAEPAAFYMSPERLDNRPLTKASDIYSLGVIAYECLAGDVPFRSTPAAGLRERHGFERPPRLPEDIPLSVNAVVMRAMSKSPEDRFPSAAAMAADCRQINYAATVLAPLLTEDQEQAPPPPVDRPVPATAPLRSPSVAEAFVRRVPAETNEPGIGLTAPISRPATPPDPETEDAPKQSKKLRVRVLAVSVVLLLAVTLIVINLWPASEPEDSANAGADTTTTTLDTVESWATTGETSASSSSHTSSPSSTTSSSSASPSPTHPSSSSAPDPTTPGKTSSKPHSPTAKPKVSVPDVIGMSSEAAESKLSGEGFGVAVNNTGSGDISCAVDSQSPGGGTNVSPGSTVTINVKLVDDEKDCPEGADTP